MMFGSIPQDIASIFLPQNLNGVLNNQLQCDMIDKTKTLLTDYFLIKDNPSLNIFRASLQKLSHHIRLHCISAQPRPIRTVRPSIDHSSKLIGVIKINYEIELISMLPIATEIIASAVENGALLIVVLAKDRKQEQRCHYYLIHYFAVFNIIHYTFVSSIRYQPLEQGKKQIGKQWINSYQKSIFSSNEGINLDSNQQRSLVHSSIIPLFLQILLCNVRFLC